METSPPRLVTSKIELVLVGRFAPDDFMPEKVASVGAITESEAKGARITGLLAKQFVEYALDWCTVRAVDNQLVVQTNKVPYIRIADLMLKMVKEGMKSPLVTMFGINKEFQYEYSDPESRDELGIRLAPPTAWGEWGATIEKEMKLPAEKLKHGGLMGITMRQMGLDDREAGWIDVNVNATLRTPPVESFGVTIKVNDHYQSKQEVDAEHLDAKVRDAARTDRLLNTLSENFDLSLKRSEAIVQGFMNP